MFADLNILKAQFMLDLKRGTVDMKLGVLWWFIEPLFMAVIYYFVVNLVFKHGGENYAMFILAGVVMWQYFAKSVLAGTRVITTSANLILQSRLPLHYLVLGPLLANTVYFGVGLLMIFILIGKAPTWEYLYLLPIVFIQLMFTYGLCLISSVLNTFIRDTHRMLGFILRAWWFFSPILYDKDLVLQSDRLPDAIKTLFVLNPFTNLVEMLRQILIDQMPISYQDFFIPLSVAAVLLLIGIIFFNKNKHQLVKYL